MKQIIFFTTLLVSVAMLDGCAKKDKPDDYLSKEKQASVIRQTVYFATKLAPQATYETRHNADFNWYYDAAAAEFDLRKLYPAEDGSYFYLMTRKARSIWPAREAIGGKLKINDKNQLVDYEETFRTWKMAEDSLNTRAFELFNLMVQGKDLTPYESRFRGDRYIEFPDEHYKFNKKLWRWTSPELDSLNIKGE